MSAATTCIAALSVFATAVSAHNADRIRPPREVLETRSGELRGLGVFTVSVSGVVAADGLFDELVAEVVHQGNTVQRIPLTELINIVPLRSDTFVEIVDVNRNGNDDLWITVDAAVHNHTMLLFLYDVRQKKFVKDRSFVNPFADPKSGCVRQHISNGAAGWRGKASVWCRVRGQWVKRFERTQDDRKHPGEIFIARQTDYTV